MSYNAEAAVFSTVADFFAATNSARTNSTSRIVHCVNPFPADPGSEHDRAQRITLASMARARGALKVFGSAPMVDFAKITQGADYQTELVEFDHHYRLDRTILDLKSFEPKRPLPLIMDILNSVAIGPDDILIYTNVDIALVPSFYAFTAALFQRGADCAIINRRTVSGAYSGDADLALMECEAGAPHPGFDCFAFRGALRDRLAHYESCVGIGGVMLPLVHQLLAFADRPVVLLDAHATYHLGDDKTWVDSALAAYTQHNRHEIDRVFSDLVADGDVKGRLLARLSGAHKDWIFPDTLRALAGMKAPSHAAPARGFLSRLGLRRRP